MDFNIKQSKGRPHSWRPPIGAEALRCHAINAIGHSWNRETAVSGLCWGCVEFLGCNGKRGKKSVSMSALATAQTVSSVLGLGYSCAVHYLKRCVKNTVSVDQWRCNL